MTEHPIPEDLQAELLAARIMDWKQVALNHTYGRPCFHLEPEGRFCGRAEGWHDKTTDRLFHLFTPLESFIERIAKAEQERDHLLKVNAEQAARYWEITGNRNRFANKLLEALGRDPLNSEDVSILDEVERIKAEADALHDEIDALKAQIQSERVKSRLMGLEDGAQAFGDKSLMQEIESLYEAIDEQMVSCQLGVFNRGDDARKTINTLMHWSQGVGEYFALRDVDEEDKQAWLKTPMLSSTVLTHRSERDANAILANRRTHAEQPKCRFCDGNEHPDRAAERPKK